MKDLFISMGEKVSVRNFVDGTLRHHEMPAPEIAGLIEKTRSSGGKVQAYFDFGSVPSEKKTREFRDLLDAFEKVTGVRLSKNDFKAESDDPTGEGLPNFNFIPTVTEKMNMLAVEYYFSHNQGSDSFDAMFSVCDTGMNFHFFERSL